MVSPKRNRASSIPIDLEYGSSLYHTLEEVDAQTIAGEGVSSARGRGFGVLHVNSKAAAMQHTL